MEIHKNFSTLEATGNLTVIIGEDISVTMEMTVFPLPESDVIKLNLHTSAGDTVNCGTAEVRGDKFYLEKTVDVSDEIIWAEVIRKNVFTDDIITVVKIPIADDDSSAEDINEIRKRLELLQENPAYKTYLDIAEDIKSPLDAAAEALNNLQEVLSRSHKGDEYLQCMAYIRNIARNYAPVYDMPEGFEWYRIGDFNGISQVSAIEHILCTGEAAKSFKKFGYYLLGIKNNEDTVCIALPMNPLDSIPPSCVDDCAVYIPCNSRLEYCTVCVAFMPEGQYFMPIC